MVGDGRSPGPDSNTAEVFDAISHPVRIKILEALNEKPMGFAALRRSIGIESGGHLSFHLAKLRHLIRTDARGDYVLTAEGRDALRTVHTLTESRSAFEAAGSRANRLAILPFTNIGPDPSDEFLAEGMTEEIISTASGISGLDVISRTSVMGYKGTTKRVEEVGKELNVGSILEGSFRRDGARIRVTVQLIEAARDRHLWGQNFDRRMDDIFEVQSSIAHEVAKALSVKIPSRDSERTERRLTENLDAYTLYLKGRYLWNMRGGEKGDESVKEAIKCFEKAVGEDSRFALGYVGQADCYLALGGKDLPGRDAVHEKAKMLVDKALELDPTLAEAYATEGLVLMYEYKYREAEEKFRRAIELRPNYPLAHNWYSNIFFHRKRWKEALEESEKALELDPLSPEAIDNQAHMYYHMKDYDKALELWRRVTALNPNYEDVHVMMANAYVELKKPEDTAREIKKYADLVRASYPLVGLRADFLIAASKDDRREMRRIGFEEETHFRETSLHADNMAVIFFMIGELDKGLEWLERSYSWKEPGMLELSCAHQFDAVRKDPRFVDLLKRVGLD